MPNYVAYLIAQDLQGKRRRGRPTSAKPGDERIGYELVVPITIPDRRELEDRARKELRSLSGYVSKKLSEPYGQDVPSASTALQAETIPSRSPSKV